VLLAALVIVAMATVAYSSDDNNDEPKVFVHALPLEMPYLF
jgi:hypothetical protein